MDLNFNSLFFHTKRRGVGRKLNISLSPASEKADIRRLTHPIPQKTFKLSTPVLPFLWWSNHTAWNLHLELGRRPMNIYSNFEGKCYDVFKIYWALETEQSYFLGGLTAKNSKIIFWNMKVLTCTRLPPPSKKNGVGRGSFTRKKKKLSWTDICLGKYLSNSASVACLGWW